MPRPDDPAIIEKVCEATRLGHPIETAGELAGLGSTVAWDWHRKGKELLEANLGTEAGELGPHAIFASAVNLARAEMLARCLKPVNDQIDQGNWVPGMTLAERRFPNDFGRQQRIEHTGTVVHVPLIAAPAQMAALEAVKAQLEQLQAESVDGEVKQLPEGTE